MRIIEIMERVMKHNELLVKMIKGEEWFANKNISQTKKDQQEPRFMKLLEGIGRNAAELEKAGVTFIDTIEYSEVLHYIEIPEALKRDNVEMWLEKYHEYKQKAAV
jgi:hypothetical protein